MPKQSGLFPIEGSMGNVTFYKTKDGFMVKTKSKISKERLNNDPSFARFRESRNEFLTARKGAELVLTVFQTTIPEALDTRVLNRLASRMNQVVKSDQSSVKGFRNVADGDLSLLKEFEFNKLTKLRHSFKVLCTNSIDRVTGQLKVIIPAYTPKFSIVKPDIATHYRLVAIGLEADFLGKEIFPASTASAYLPWDESGATAPLTLTVPLNPNSTLPLVLAFGIEFYQEVNGVKYPSSDNSFNACTILALDV